MKQTFIRRAALVSMAAIAVLTAGCASVAVTEDALTTNTAFALGLQKDQFTISNRADSGVKTTYMVETKTGRKYNCYVTGTFGVTGRTVSDAICSEMGKAGEPSPSTESTGGSCNALLKAAGKCK